MENGLVAVLAVVALLGSCSAEESSAAARTFGRPIRKLQAALLPIMFKLGVMATLIFLTFLLSLKSVVIGKLLLLFKAIGLFLKLKSEWHPHKAVHHPWSGGPDAYGGGVEAWNRVGSGVRLTANQATRGPSSVNTPYGHYVRTGDPTAPSAR